MPVKPFEAFANAVLDAPDASAPRYQNLATRFAPKEDRPDGPGIGGEWRQDGGCRCHSLEAVTRCPYLTVCLSNARAYGADHPSGVCPDCRHAEHDWRTDGARIWCNCDCDSPKR